MKMRYFILLLLVFFNPCQSNQEIVFTQYNEYFKQVNSSSNAESIGIFFTKKENLESKQAVIRMKERGFSDDYIADSMWKYLARGARFKEISDHAEGDYSGDSKCLVIRGLYHNNKWVSAIHKFDYENGTYKIDSIFLDYDDGGGDQIFIHANLDLCDLLHSETAT
jgi:hypothetical protein